MVQRSLVLLAVVGSALLSPLPALAQSGEWDIAPVPTETHLGRFRFDRSHSVITIPLSGLLPSLAWDDHANRRHPRMAILDIPGLGHVSARLESPRTAHLRHNNVRYIRLRQLKHHRVRLTVIAWHPIRLSPSLVHRTSGWALRVRVLRVKPKRHHRHS